MRWFTVLQQEYSGYDCDGHDVDYIVAANSPEEAASLFPRGIFDDPVKVYELTLPDLARKKKPFIYHPSR